MLKENENCKVINDVLFKKALTSIENRDFLEYILEKFLNLKEGKLRNKLNIVYEEGVNYNNLTEKEKVRKDIVIAFDDTRISLNYHNYLDEVSKRQSRYYADSLFASFENLKSFGKLHIIQINIVDKIKKGLLLDKAINKYSFLEKDNMMELTGNYEIYYYQIDKAKEKNKSDVINRFLKYLGAETNEKRKEIVKGNRHMEKFDKWIQNYICRD